jgi:hypothetical protein
MTVMREHTDNLRSFMWMCLCVTDRKQRKKCLCHQHMQTPGIITKEGVPLFVRGCVCMVVVDLYICGGMYVIRSGTPAHHSQNKIKIHLLEIPPSRCPTWSVCVCVCMYVCVYMILEVHAHN